MNPTFDLEKELFEQRGDEWRFGSIAKDLALLPKAERTKYLPDGVLQFNDVFDSYGCASRAPLNVLEAKLTRFYDHGMHPELKKWCDDNGYRVDGKFVLSDNFIEILSGTTPTGNSLKAPLEAIRKHGVIPARFLPLTNGLTWDEYMDKNRITKEMTDLGQEFKARFTINYEQVKAEDFEQALEDDPNIVAGHGWPVPWNGEYPASDAPPNHAFAHFPPVMDNYEPFHKTLAKDYNFFDWGYQIAITAQNPNPMKDQLTLIGHLLNVIGLLLSQIFNRPNVDIPPAELPMNQPIEEKPAPADLIAKAAIDALGKDLTPDDEIPDEVACVAQIVKVLEPTPYHLKGSLAFTPDLVTYLRNDKRWKATLTPKAGRIVVSPTVGDIKGHCGIFITDTRIASNDSRNGKWQDNYSWESWITYFKGKHLRIFIFEPVDIA